MIFYPSADDALAAHARVIARFGGAEGIRDRGSLEAALARPRIGHYKDLIEQATALLESLSQNHPFLDGNKRTAIVVTAAFLRVNGHRLKFDDTEAFEFLNQLYASNQFRFASLEPWIRRHTSKA